LKKKIKTIKWIIIYSKIKNIMQKILIIEDDKWIAESLKLYLENSNFEVFMCHNWNEAINCVNKYVPDLVILDINLPWKNWIDICKEISPVKNLSIIMLTARSSELDKITWLEIWADDYIGKPFSPRELLARINTILRRSGKNLDQNKDSNHLDFKNITLDLDKKIVFVNNEIIWLTWNEFELLRKIIEANWKLVTRDVLMTEVMWYDNYVYDRTIDTHIKNLRKKVW
jgi:DNA-binding response OmpR family regulator